MKVVLRGEGQGDQEHTQDESSSSSDDDDDNDDCAILAKITLLKKTNK